MDRKTDSILLVRHLVERHLKELEAHKLDRVDLALELTARALVLMLDMDLEEARQSSLRTWRSICANITDRAAAQKKARKVVPFGASPPTNSA